MMEKLIPPGLRTYGPNIAWLFGEKLIRLIVSFTVTVYVTRYLGPGNFGLLSFALSFCALFATFTNLGLDSILIRDLVKTPERKHVLLGTSSRLKLIGGIGGMALIWVVARFAGYDAATITSIMVIALGMLFQPMNVAELYFQSQVSARLILFANLFTVVIVSALKIYLISVGAGLLAFAWVTVIEKLVLGGALLVLYQRDNGDLQRWRFDMDTSREMLRNSFPLIISGMVIMIYMRIDQIMIKEMMSNVAVGYYSAAVYVAEGWYFLGMAINSTLFPAIVKAKQENEALYYHRLQKLCRTMVWVALAVAIPVSFTADKIILLLYGPAYQLSADALRISIWTGVFVFLGVASSSWLISENLQRLTLYRTTAGAVLNIVLNFLTIPRYGIAGAAMSTLISQAVASYLAFAFCAKTSRMFKMQTLAFIPPFADIWRKYAGLEKRA
jgi:O-antigen/teichoic acid export membrane protein